MDPIPAEFRLYRLCRIFGWTIEEAWDQPAGLSDWMLALHDAEEAARATPPDED